MADRGFHAFSQIQHSQPQPPRQTVGVQQQPPRSGPTFLGQMLANLINYKLHWLSVLAERLAGNSTVWPTAYHTPAAGMMSPTAGHLTPTPHQGAAAMHHPPLTTSHPINIAQIPQTPGTHASSQTHSPTNTSHSTPQAAHSPQALAAHASPAPQSHVSPSKSPATQPAHGYKNIPTGYIGYMLANQISQTPTPSQTPPQKPHTAAHTPTAQHPPAAALKAASQHAPATAHTPAAQRPPAAAYTPVTKNPLAAAQNPTAQNPPAAAYTPAAKNPFAAAHKPNAQNPSAAPHTPAAQNPPAAPHTPVTKNPPTTAPAPQPVLPPSTETVTAEPSNVPTSSDSYAEPPPATVDTPIQEARESQEPTTSDVLLSGSDEEVTYNPLSTSALALPGIVTEPEVSATGQDGVTADIPIADSAEEGAAVPSPASEPPVQWDLDGYF